MNRLHFGPFEVSSSSASGVERQFPLSALPVGQVQLLLQISYQNVQFCNSINSVLLFYLSRPTILLLVHKLQIVVESRICVLQLFEFLIRGQNLQTCNKYLEKLSFHLGKKNRGA